MNDHFLSIPFPKIQKLNLTHRSTASLETLQALRRVVGVKYLGPSPTFSELHVLRALLLIGEKGAIGRAALAESLGLGHGMVRTLIERLRSEHIIKVEREGCILTKKGLLLRDGFKASIVLPQKIDAGRLAVDAHSAAILVRNAGQKVKIGLEQRDAAVRAGATGATTIILRKGKYVVPMSSTDSEREFPNEVWSTIKGILAPKDSDVIIVCSAKSEKEAEYGALAAALTFVV